jgi:hypothetical protein
MTTSQRPVLETPTTKAQRAEFATLNESDQLAMQTIASKLYDGTLASKLYDGRLTVSECWREAFDRLHALRGR